MVEIVSPVIDACSLSNILYGKNQFNQNTCRDSHAQRLSQPMINRKQESIREDRSMFRNKNKTKTKPTTPRLASDEETISQSATSVVANRDSRTPPPSASPVCLGCHPKCPQSACIVVIRKTRSSQYIFET